MATMKEKREKKERRYADAKKRANEHQTGSFARTAVRLPQGMKNFGIKKAGTYRIDIIPYVVTQEGNRWADPGFLHYERSYFAHRNVGPNQDMYVCPARTWDKRCPICEHRAKLSDDPESDATLLKEMVPKERQLFNVIDLDHPEEGVQMWDISHHLFGKLLDAKIKMEDEGDNYSTFHHLEDGMYLKLGAVEKSMGGGRPFYEVVDIEFKRRKEQYTDAIMEKCADLDAALIEVPYKELRAIFLQLEGDAKQEESPSRNGALKAGKKPQEDVADFDDDSDLEDDDDVDDATDSELEDEAVAPAKPAKPAKKPAKPAAKPSTAESAGLKEGDRVLYNDAKYEIDRISRDGTSLTLIDDDGEEIKGVGVDEVAKAKRRPAPEAAPKSAAKKPAKAKPPADDDDDDDWDDDDDAPAAKPAKKPTKAAAKAKPPADDDDDWDDETPVKPAKASSKAAKAKPPADDEDDEDEDW